jgi:hypothetical protein
VAKMEKNDDRKKKSKKPEQYATYCFLKIKNIKPK